VRGATVRTPRPTRWRRRARRRATSRAGGSSRRDVPSAGTRHRRREHVGVAGPRVVGYEGRGAVHGLRHGRSSCSRRTTTRPTPRTASRGGGSLRASGREPHERGGTASASGVGAAVAGRAMPHARRGGARSCGTRASSKASQHRSVSDTPRRRDCGRRAPRRRHANGRRQRLGVEAQSVSASPTSSISDSKRSSCRRRSRPSEQVRSARRQGRRPTERRRRPSGSSGLGAFVRPCETIAPTCDSYDAIWTGCDGSAEPTSHATGVGLSLRTCDCT